MLLTTRTRWTALSAADRDVISAIIHTCDKPNAHKLKTYCVDYAYIDKCFLCGDRSVYDIRTSWQDSGREITGLDLHGRAAAGHPPHRVCITCESAFSRTKIKPSEPPELRKHNALLKQYLSGRKRPPFTVRIDIPGMTPITDVTDPDKTRKLMLANYRNKLEALDDIARLREILWERMGSKSSKRCNSKDDLIAEIMRSFC